MDKKSENGRVGHERQGADFDPHAFGHERAGRGPLPEPEQPPTFVKGGKFNPAPDPATETVTLRKNPGPAGLGVFMGTLPEHLAPPVLSRAAVRELYDAFFAAAQAMEPYGDE